MTEIKDVKNIRGQMVVDGWQNIMTSLNIKGKDKKMSHVIGYDFLDEATASALYQASDVAQTIVDVLPDEMTREGFTVQFEDDEGKTLSGLTNEWVDEHFVEDYFNEAFKTARLYGGSAIYMSIDDGQEPDKPVNSSTIKGVKYLAVFDRYDLIVEQPINGNVNSKNFGKPDYYSLTTALGDKAMTLRIHESRLIVFHGKQLPRRIAEMNQYWGDSVLSNSQNAIRNYDCGFDSTASIMEDFTVPILQIDNLDDLLCSGQDDLIIKRLELIKRTASIVNAIVMKTGENYERKTTNVAGIKDILEKFEQRLVTSSRIPHTILLGQSPSGLGATGESERNTWYDYVKAQQKRDYLPKLNKLFNYLFMTPEFKSSQGKDWRINFNPLWQMSQKQTVELRKMQAETDAINISNGIIDPAEVTNSRYGGAEYSIETKLDTEMREAMGKIEIEPEEIDEIITPDEAGE